ncbi:hypothetical protein EIP91_010796, partial [Steccherinum ochraceum]
MPRGHSDAPCKSVSAFPQELIDLIAEASDAQTRKTLVFVSASWLNAAYRCIYHTIVIFNPWSSTSQPSLRGFAQALEQGPRLRQHVRVLRLSCDICVPMLLSVIEKLPNLHTIRIRSAHIQDPLNFNFPPSSLSQRSMREILFLNSTIVSDYSVSFQLYLSRMFARVDRLRLAGSEYIDALEAASDHDATLGPLASAEDRALSTKISSLVIPKCGPGTAGYTALLTKILLRDFDLQHLTVLSVPMWPLDCCLSYAPLAAAVSTTVHKLIVDFRDPLSDIGEIHRASTVWTSLGFSSYTSVESIHFMFLVPNEKLKIWDHILNFLSTLSSSQRITKLIFQTAYFTDTRHNMPWSRLQDTLLAFSGVREIVFAVPYWYEEGLGGENYCPKTILERLPLLRKKLSF